MAAIGRNRYSMGWINSDLESRAICSPSHILIILHASSPDFPLDLATKPLSHCLPALLFLSCTGKKHTLVSGIAFCLNLWSCGTCFCSQEITVCNLRTILSYRLWLAIMIPSSDVTKLGFVNCFLSVWAESSKAGMTSLVHSKQAMVVTEVGNLCLVGQIWPTMGHSLVHKTTSPK